MENLGKVIVFPFFVTAIGLLLYAASIYIISYQGVPDFPLSTETISRYILWSTIAGIVAAITGVIVQHIVTKKIADLQKQEIIEVI
jgi:putative membrane protein